MNSASLTSIAARCAALVIGLCAWASGSVWAADGGLYDIKLKDIDGKETTLREHAGKVLLIVNVASQCGATPQYEGLEALWKAGKADGLVVCGFPCNDFGGQEPGTNADIKTFCSGTYSVTFPMYDKVSIITEPAHPLFTALTGKASAKPGPVEWNFTKFLIDRDGKLIARFDTSTEPTAPEVLAAIENALKAKASAAAEPKK